MADATNEPQERSQPGIRRHLPKLRWVLLGALVVVLLLWTVPVFLEFIVDFVNSRGGISGLKYPYLVLGAFVMFDAVLPILPSESLLTAASTLAAQGSSDLVVGYVLLAGAIGAVLGDSLLYWISRTVGRRVLTRKLDDLKRDERVALVLDVLGRTAPLLITLGRFVPGVRFAVNVTMGISEYPYPRFLLFSAIGGFAWSAYTCVFSFWIGQALDGYPVLSIVTSALVTTALVMLMYFPLRRSYDRAKEQGAQPVPAAG